ncbi:MAG: HNH endonuclease [Saprospiraceae bacterium]|nr:HNH endonuclease [Saprospiraceae bacterium]
MRKWWRISTPSINYVIIYHAEEADKLTYLKLLDKEGTDIYAHIRRPELQQIQNVADNLLNAEKRVHLSDILKSMDNATLNQLEKDLAGEDGEALRALFGEKVGCVRAWEKLSVLSGTREWTRQSIPLLEKMSGKSDEFMDRVKQYYSTHQKPGGTPNPPFNYQGIDFDELGHPDFFNSNACPGHEYCLKTPDLQGHPIGGLPSDLKHDFNLANQNLLSTGKEINVLHGSGSPILIKIEGKWEGPFTWHHHQDGKTMIPVKQDVHNSFPHTGGDSAIKKEIKGFFDSPF